MHIVYSKDLDITFLISPKSGYHTIMHLILSIERNKIINTSDYKEKAGDYLTLLNNRVFRDSVVNTKRNMEKKCLLAVVRNPYTRCLSSFSDKLNRLPDRKFRKAAMNSEYTQEVFDSAVSLLNKEVNDDHWRPISSQLSDFFKNKLYVEEINSLYIHKINLFYLEDMDRFYDFLLLRAPTKDVKEIIELHRGTRKNRSGSSHKYKSFINDINSHLIYQYYKDDFLNFGYSNLPERMSDPGNKSWKI